MERELESHRLLVGLRLQSLFDLHTGCLIDRDELSDVGDVG